MTNKSKVTKIKKIRIEEFRGLKNVDINFGERLTVICGKNGTSKSTILGIVAQMFNFETDYTLVPPDDLRKHKTLADKSFTSDFAEHFRLSSDYDKPSTMNINVHIYDGAEDKELDQLKLGLYLRSGNRTARATVRNNTTTNGASDSRKVTHPIIFLSLKRLTPISERIKYSEKEVKDFMEENRDEFISYSSSILGRRGAVKLTQTTGTIASMVASGDNYDHKSVSVGEDNIGQILQSMFSFKKLKQDYDNYHGGIILIDEVDAGLFPAAQRRLIDKLIEFSKILNLQVIMTSHSPEIINTLYKFQEKDPVSYKTIYLSDTYGKVQAFENYSWMDIKLDLHNQTRKIEEEIGKTKINVFFEDKENYDFFNALVTKRDIKSLINSISNVSLGCGNYLELIRKKVPGFYTGSIIVLDGDVNNANYSNVVLLPTTLPPDQLIFEMLYNLEADHPYWKNNKIRFTKDVFLERSDDICAALKIKGCDKIILSDLICEFYKSNNKDKKEVLRKLFKRLMQDDGISHLVNKGGVDSNPYRLWCTMNEVQVDNFNSKFIDALRNEIGNEIGVEVSAIKPLIKK
ncbi:MULTISPECIES: AAA family ATPase [Yersinia]|uniref:AAA family ATPase n=1 Tax=Yersinia TaxID=629 RepID=UPI0005E4D5E6|nr:MULTISPECIES: AAA family ATPase [Yersinia]UNK25285.1 AAA family ATPase [Yersinia intermedia]CQJ56065.1 Predicted ATP-binding protein involved in virulence [Yersinia enterocolitica]